MAHNELKCGKKSILAGQCTVCLKGKNQHLKKKIPSGAAPKVPAEWEKISKNVDFSLWGNCATTQSTFFDIFKWDQNHENHT